jgi:hypothetical protein
VGDRGRTARGSGVEKHLIADELKCKGSVIKIRAEQFHHF